jgi:uncharacterized zinc-type alcohol dehydrogenase-like protein
VNTLAPNGRLHVVGAVLEPIPVRAFGLIQAQRCISGSPTGSPVAIETMLDFAARHNIAPQTEALPDEQDQRRLRAARVGQGEVSHRPGRRFLRTRHASRHHRTAHLRS